MPICILLVPEAASQEAKLALTSDLVGRRKTLVVIRE